MKYRNLGDFEVSALGFGAMRLPTNSYSKSDIDEEQTIKMIRYAVDKGVNYVDTAWPYHSGESERVVGKALKDGYRQQVKLATKLPSWLISSQQDMDKYLNKQLEKLQTDRIDYYLLHALNHSKWNRLLDADVFSWIKKVKKEGKIDKIGFSFHDDYELFEEIMKSYDWDFTQIQYNYLDTDFQAGRKGLELASEMNVPLIIMEPLRGGDLAQNPPEPVQRIIDSKYPDRSPADLALQWLWSQPEVGVVLSGMSNMQQVRENVESADNSEIGLFNQKELNAVEQAARDASGPIDCTSCGYCLPCPNGIEIPKNFRIYNQAHQDNNYKKYKKEYMEIKEEARAGACIECGECEPKCPQQLPIMELLKEVAHYFEN